MKYGLKFLQLFGVYCAAGIQQAAAVPSGAILQRVIQTGRETPLLSGPEGWRPASGRCIKAVPHQRAIQPTGCFWWRVDVVQVAHTADDTADAENTRLCPCGCKHHSRAGWLRAKHKIKANHMIKEAEWLAHQLASLLLWQQQRFSDVPLRFLIGQS